jgi:uncharacterized protein DUF2637
MERHPDSASSPGFPADPTAARSAPRRNWLNRLVNFAVAIVVLAVAAGTFFLSYPGVHAIALQGGVSTQLARFYPAVFDAVLVIACVAAVMLRDARWWARCWAWLVVIVLLAAIGATDVLHAASYGLQRRPTEGVVAAAPVVAVLLAFSLFLTLLRQSRPQVTEAGGSQPPPPAPSDRYPAEAPTASMMFTTADARELAAGAMPRPPAPPIALPAAPAQADPPDRDSEPTPAGGTAEVADAAQAAEVADAPETARTQETPELAADPVDAVQDPGTAATREEPALAASAPERPDAIRPATIAGEAVDQPDPSAEVAPESAEVAPEPTPEPEAEAAAEVPSEPVAAVPSEPVAAVPSEPVAKASAESQPESAPEPEPTRAPAPTPQAIRYASSAASEQFANEDWEAEVDPALAGQVYPVLTSDPDIEVPPLRPGQSQDLEDDAPPFATAPFASVPRLNRVRVSPTPPIDDGED